MTAQQKEDKLLEFITNNNLDFNQTNERGKTDSGLNGACTVLSGYAQHIGADVDITINAAKRSFIKIPSTFYTLERELKSVYSYAKHSRYGEFWTSAKAKKMYKF